MKRSCATISTIQQREYVARGDKAGEKRKVNVLKLKDNRISESNPQETFGSEKKKLIPTDMGLVVNDFLTEFFPEIMDYNFTAKVEKDFDHVAEGKENWHELMRNFYASFEPQVEKILNEKTEHKVGERELGIDPTTGKTISVKIGRFGPMVQLGTADESEKPLFASLKLAQSARKLEEVQCLFERNCLYALVGMERCKERFLAFVCCAQLIPQREKQSA